MSLAVTKSFRSNEVEVGRRNGELTEEDVERCLQGGGTTRSTKKRWFVGLRRKKAVKEENAVVKLPGNGQFTSISHPAPLQLVGAMSNRDFGACKSRTPVLEEIMNALTSVDVNVIGVYGIGGVGKTTLVKEAAKQAKEDKLFDEVVLATVTNDVNVQIIQAQIADFLGLKFDVETVEGRATQLCGRLKQKKVLIILDDLWKKLDLEAVGIRFKDEPNGCKIVLTSRDLNVLSNGMDSQKKFVVGALQEDEAWDLFKKMAHENFEDPDLQSTAKEVAKVCGGLPIAIVMVARALKNKSLSEWKNALNELRGRNFTEMHGVCSPIEFSYRHLEGEELKSIFLLCGQMGYNATTGDLLKYGIGLGLFHNVSTLEQAQNKVHTLVQKLKASCMLLADNTSKQLAMHDIVRGVALSIAFKEHNMLIVDDENILKEWANEDIQKNYTAIWLRCGVSELPGAMHCPKLLFFLIRTGDPDLEIPGNLFKGLYKLEVLNLTGFFFTYLPPSLGSLKNLKALCLHECVLENVGLVGELQKLEILSFVKSDIKHLPREIGELANLRLLDLSDCWELEVIPWGVLSRLCRLEELYLGKSFSNWEIEGLNSEGRKNASLLELKHLGCLSNLDIHIRDAHSIPQDIFSEKLCRYRIFIGDTWGKWEWNDVYETSKTVKLKLSIETHMDIGVIRPLLKKTEDLYLHGLKGVKNIVYELDSDGFPKLRHLRLSGSPDIQHIIDAMEMVAFPMLETLILRDLISLEKISHYKLKMQSFSKLRIIEVTGCDRLTYVFSFLVAQVLSRLEEIKVEDCGGMEEIVGEGSDEVHGNEIVETNAIEFSRLHSLSLSNLRKLKGFCSNEDGRRSMPAGSGRTISEDGAEGAMPLFNGRILFPNLKDLTLFYVKNQTLWYTHLLSAARNSFQNLTNVNVWFCHGLKYLFPLSLVEYLPQLKHLNLHGCKTMKEVIGVERSGEEQGINKVLFPKLQSLELDNLPKLTRFCECFLIECPLLKKLTIYKCRSLTIFVSKSKAISNEGQEKSQDEMHTWKWPQLKRLTLEGVEVGKLFGGEMPHEAHADVRIQHLLPQQTFSNLEELSLCGEGVAASLTFLHQFPSNLFSTIKKLQLREVYQREGISIAFLQKFYNLKEFGLYGSKLEKVFSYDGLATEKDHTPTLTPLRHLEIHQNSSLRHIWDEDDHVASLLKYIKTLDVKSCHRLENLAPSSASFQNLTSLFVKYCNGLSNLITTMTAKSLGQLIHFKVESCDKVTKIIDREGDETKDDIIFPKLQSLKLVSLKSLTSFYSGNYTFQFPSLEEVHVEKCPKLKVFSPAVVNTPKLLQVYFTDQEKCWEGNLNTTIRQLHTEMDQVVGQSIQPSSLQQPNLEENKTRDSHIEATKTRENKAYALREAENLKELSEPKNLDASKEYTPEIGTGTTITADEHALKGSYAEPEITQTASSYQITDAILNDKTEPPQGQVSSPASIQQIGTAPACSTSANEMAPLSTFVSVAGRKMPQETKRRKTVGRISDIEMDHDPKEFDMGKTEDEDAASNKPPTNPDMSSVDQKITPTTLTQSSLPQNASTSLCPNLAKLNEMCPEEMLSFLLEQHNTMAIEAPTPTETVLEPTTPIDVDEKVMAIKTVSNFLSKSIESFGDPTVVSDVQSACNLLCATQQMIDDGIVSLQQMIVIRSLSIELPLLTQRFQQASSIIGKDDCARFDLKHIFEEAASKAQEVALLTKKRSQLQNRILDDEKEIKNMEVQLAMLRSRVKQDKEAMADLRSSIRTACKEADTWELKAVESEKMNECMLATVRKAKAEYEASKKQLEAHASSFFKT